MNKIERKVHFLNLKTGIGLCGIHSTAVTLNATDVNCKNCIRLFKYLKPTPWYRRLINYLFN